MPGLKPASTKRFRKITKIAVAAGAIARVTAAPDTNVCRWRVRRIAVTMIEIDTNSVIAAQASEKLPNHRICQR